MKFSIAAQTLRSLALYLAIGLLCACAVDREDQLTADRPVDFSQVLSFAERARAAYFSPAEIRQRYPDTVRVTTLDGIDVQYFLERDSATGRQLVSVRGTSNLANAREDAEYIPSRNTKLGIYVHRGFDEDATLVYADLLPHLDRDHAVTVTGHSLGAAIGTLIMMYLHEDGFTVAPSVNFGQPKVTNGHGVARYQFLPLLRVVDEEDVVPLVPPVTLLDSVHGIYTHLGEELILLERSYYSYLDAHDASRHSAGSFWNNLGHQSIEQHFIANYIARIETKLDGATAVSYADRDRYMSHN